MEIPKKIFLIAKDKLGEDGRVNVEALLRRNPSLTGFYWAKEKIRELENKEDAL